MGTRRTFRKSGAAAAAAIALLGLGACATPFEARVQHYQALPPLQGQTFRIVPVDPQRRGTLEFETYAQVVGERLQRFGLRPAADPSAAQFVVELDYGSGPARERIASRNVSVGVGWGNYGGWYGGGRWGWPGWGDPFWAPDIYSYSIYPAFMEMRILRAADRAPLFEGRADATTRTNDLTVAVPKLADALFHDFPGQRVFSGTVKVPTSGQQKPAAATTPVAPAPDRG
jgi:hypothetical protein